MADTRSWVALRDVEHPRRPGERQEQFIRRPGVSWTTDEADAYQFFSRREARAALAAPRIKGVIRKVRARGRASEHSSRPEDTAVCPDVIACAVLYHYRLCGGDHCECCGQLVDADETVGETQ